MAQNKVEVLLTAKDEISGQLKGIVAGFAATLGGLAIAAISIGKLKDGITSAASAQTSLIVSAGDVGSLMGVSYGKALSVVKGIQTEISKMAAALPGETAGYSQIANGITATMALGAKGNLKKFRDDTVELTRTLGMLAATKGVDMTQAAGAANKLVSGSAGLGELFGTNDVFQKNPLFRLYLNAELKNLGKHEKDWEKLFRRRLS